MANGCIFTARGQIEIVIFISHCGGAVFVAKAQNESPAPKNDPNTGLDMLECAHCKTYVTPEEAVYAKGCVYCSKACLKESAC
ncbi:hypothetical protein NHP21005_11000 [Helicobacter sp. NHP21005]|nr:hypothetical protein NHP21005_11000 [Helicobacter sp. NHP21005]